MPRFITVVLVCFISVPLLFSFVLYSIGFHLECIKNGVGIDKFLFNCTLLDMEMFITFSKEVGCLLAPNLTSGWIWMIFSG